MRSGMVGNVLMWFGGASRFWYVAFRLGLVRFDWASLGKAVLERKGTARRGEAWHGGLGAVGSGTVCPGELRRGLARRSWPCEFRLGEIGRGVSRRSSRGVLCAGKVCFGGASQGGQKSLY